MSVTDTLKRNRVRERAVKLLGEFFTGDGEQGRRTVFNLAFGDCGRDPRATIRWTGSTIEFADHAVGALMEFGCSDRGRHSLSLLLRGMAEVRGRQSNPDFFDLPVLLDNLCTLPTRDEELRYLARMLAEIEQKARLYAPLRGIAEIKPAEHAKALLAPWREDEDIALLRHQARARKAAVELETKDYEDILAAFDDVKRAMLLGAPGAGKSTTLRKLATGLARRAHSDPQAPVPILVSLGEWHDDETLERFLADRAGDIGWAVQGLSSSGRLVLLLDGLNEVPTAKRKAKADGVSAFIGQLPEATACVVSCRRDDYVGDLDLGLDTLSLEPLSPQRIRSVLRQWLPDDAEGVEHGSADRLFWQLAGDERLEGVLATWLEAGADEVAFWSVADPSGESRVYTQTSVEEDELWRRHVPNPRSLLRLASNPFMLTMLFQVWAFEGELPPNRGDLFARFVSRLLAREGLLLKDEDSGSYNHTPDGKRLLNGLSEVAWRMQGRRIESGQAEANDFGVLTVLDRKELLGILGSESLLKKAEDATLLEGGAEIRFRHQLLQEYFTASAMRRRIEGTPPLKASELWPTRGWWERNGWEESAVLLAGLYASDCTPVVRWLMNAQPEVAAQCILESGVEIVEQDAVFRDLHTAWLPRLADADREPVPQARAAIGRALGRLGLDVRKGVGLDKNGLPDIDWVDITGGEFIYQQDERRHIEPFRIARHPVTNAQFQAFLDAEDGYANDRWWQGLDDPDREPRQPRSDIPNRPRETVSWFEAMAFCAWLSHKLGLDIGLPTELQWERAARGIDGRNYPWGSGWLSDFANTHESGIGATSAVGIFPAGASVEGVLDLAGNVWEWCLNEYASPERVQRGGGESRVLRGGSWYYNQDVARADDRLGFHPGVRFDDGGFRLVCASPIR